MILITKRLILQSYDEKYAEKCFENWGNSELAGKYMDGFPVKSAKELKSIMELKQQTHCSLLVLLEDDTPIGLIQLSNEDHDQGVGEIGYIIGEKYQRNGYAREAILAILRRYFMEDGYHLIQARCRENNIPSRKLLESLGFTEEARLRERSVDKDTGKRQNDVIYSITSEEYSRRENADKH